MVTRIGNPQSISFVQYASAEMSKTSDPLTRFIVVAFVYVFYLPIAIVVFPLVSFLIFTVRKAFRTG